MNKNTQLLNLVQKSCQYYALLRQSTMMTENCSGGHDLNRNSSKLIRQNAFQSSESSDLIGSCILSSDWELCPSIWLAVDMGVTLWCGHVENHL